MLYALLVIIVLIIAFNAIMYVAASVEYSGNEPANAIKSTQEAGGNSDHKQTVIMFHGFGGSPDDFRDLKKELTAAGCNVVAPAIPYQNRNYFAYERGQFKAEDYETWVQELVEKHYQETGEAPIVVGFSMGGTLSILSCKKTPVKKLVLIAPYLDLTLAPYNSGVITFLMTWLTPVVPKLSKGQIFSKEGYRAYRPGSYLVSIPAFQELEELKKKARDLFSSLEMPILMIASAKDRVACYNAATRLGEPMKNCELVTTEQSNHILMYDHDADLITDSILDFVRKS